MDAIIQQSPARTRPRKWSVLQNNGWPDRGSGDGIVLFWPLFSRIWNQLL